ncbi:MAG: hypothetical protein IK096_04430, partial [Lachnospiraceae bacterium]|nr:hypothetical protein [Lachnospiraceae bacterium]
MKIVLFGGRLILTREQLIGIGVGAGAIVMGLILAVVLMVREDRRRKEEAQRAAWAESVEETDERPDVGMLIERTIPPGVAEMSVLPLSTAPGGICIAEDGTAVVTDAHAKTVWEIVEEDCHVLAGAESVPDHYEIPIGGYYDAGNTESLFREPWGIAPFMDGYAVSDPGNHVIRLVHNGITETLGGDASNMPVIIEQPMGLASDAAGNLYLSDAESGTILRVTEGGLAESILSGLSRPTGLFVYGNVLYIAESGANRILRWQNGEQEVVAGTGERGDTDGDAMSATFAAPQGIAVDDDGTIYVADTVNGAIRRIADGQVVTILAQQNDTLESWPVSPMGLCLSGGKLYVCDRFSRR